MTKELIYLNIGIVVVTVIAFIYFVGQAKLKDNGTYEAVRRQKMHNRFSKLYRNVITRKSFRRVVELYSSLSCFDTDTVKEKSVTTYTRNIMIMLMFPVVGFIATQDFTISALLIIIGYVYYNSTIDAEHDKLYQKLMEDISLMLSSLNEHYMQSNNIDTAVLHCEKGPYLETPMDQIYKILTSIKGEELLFEFQQTYPLRLLKTLANTLWIMSDYGVTQKSDGTTTFAQNMMMLRSECDQEVRRLLRQKLAFKSLLNLSLVGILIFPLFEWFLLYQIPGTSVLLKGLFGEVVELLIVLSTAVCYYYIATVNRPSVVNQTDKSQFIEDMWKHPWFRKIVKPLYPKKYRTKLKWKSKFDNALSAKTIQYVYSQKVIVSSVGFVVALIAFILISLTLRYDIYHNYDTLSFVPMTLTENQQSMLVIMDDKFMEREPEDVAAMDDTALYSLVKGSISGLADNQILNQVDRLKTKYEIYSNAVFHWWFVLVAYGVAAVLWFLPEFMLSLRKKLVEYESSEDITQLQTMMVVLSDTKMDVFKCLYWLEKQSSIHKVAIRECRYMYPGDPEGSLDVLESVSPSSDFKRLVRKLKTAIYTLSLSEAFSDMLQDKQQSLALREILRNEELESRKNSCKMIAIIPAGLALVGTFVGPVIILGVQQLMSSMTNLQGFGS